MMGRKSLIIIILLSSFAASAPARVLPSGPPFNRFRVGVEWGYTQCLFGYRDYNFFSEEGYRVYDRSYGFHWASNAQLTLQVGYALGERHLVSLLGGYIGMGKDNRLIPVAARYTFFPRSLYEDGFFAYAQAGAAWHFYSMAGQTALLGAGGAGYRFRLSDDCSIDLLVGLKYLRDHPKLIDPDRGINVPEHNIRKNVAGYCALDISIAVSF